LFSGLSHSRQGFYNFQERLLSGQFFPSFALSLSIFKIVLVATLKTLNLNSYKWLCGYLLKKTVGQKFAFVGLARSVLRNFFSLVKGADQAVTFFIYILYYLTLTFLRIVVKKIKSTKKPVNFGLSDSMTCQGQSVFTVLTFQDVLRASLQWETFEQYALWQLLNAHDLPLDCVLPLVKS